MNPYGIRQSINRNIVECKEIEKRLKKDVQLVLIETLWNVKLLLKHSFQAVTIVLIETLWNVKCTAVLPFSGIKPY